MAYTDRFPIVNNFLETRLSADCDEGATALFLESVETFPLILVGRDYLPLVLRDAGTVREIVYVERIDRDTGSVIVRRGQEGTRPTAWAAGSYAYCTVTAASFQRMRVNGFAPLADAVNGRPAITRTSSTTADISGDFFDDIEVGMAVRILSGDTVVEPADAEMGAIHVLSVAFSAGVTSVSFQNVSLPTNVDGIDLGLSVAAAPMYHPDTVVADEDTLTQTQNILRVSEKFKNEFEAELKSELNAEMDVRDAAQNEAISEAQSRADAAQRSADAAQSTADAKQDKLEYTPVKSVNNEWPDEAGNVVLNIPSPPVTSVNGMTGTVVIDVVGTKVNQAGWADSAWSSSVTPNCSARGNVGSGSNGQTIYLPAGGTWAWIGGNSAGVSAGGTGILTGNRDQTVNVLYIRIA